MYWIGEGLRLHINNGNSNSAYPSIPRGDGPAPSEVSVCRNVLTRQKECADTDEVTSMTRARARLGRLLLVLFALLAFYASAGALDDEAKGKALNTKDHASPKTTSPRLLLQDYLVEVLKKGPINLPFEMIPGRKSRVKVFAWNGAGVRISLNGSKVDMPWKLIKDSSLYDMIDPLAKAMPVREKVAYLRLGAGLGQKDTPSFEELMQQLWREAPEVAKQLEPKLGVPAERPQRSSTSPNAAVQRSSKRTVSKVNSDALSRWWDYLGGKSIDKAAYYKEATTYSLATIDRRLGPGYDFFHHGKGNKGFPTVVHKTTQFYKKCRHGRGAHYHYGEPKESPGRFNSTHGQLLYVPDQAGDPGLDRVHMLSNGHDMHSYNPEGSWLVRHRPDPAVRSWRQKTGAAITQPIAMVRSHWGWNCDAIVLYRNGVIGATGTFTSKSPNRAIQLPPHKVPTAVSITNRGEFAFVTVWDTKEVKGQVAVIALSSMHSKGLMALWDWHTNHPGIFNLGSVNTMKLLGYIDLPDMAAPTAICAAGNSSGIRFVNDLKGKWMTYGAGKLDLSDPAWRKTFWDGSNISMTETAGFAVVVSKYERKIAFLDLRPLFAYYRQMYFTTPSNYKATRNQGDAPNQWPYTFEHEKRQKPKVVKVARIPYRYAPTAVMAALYGGPDAWVAVATVDGKVFVYRVGSLSEAVPTGPVNIRAVGSFVIGKNPVQLAFKNGRKKHARDTFLAVCRGDREIQWVTISGNSGSVTKRLRDSRLIDPVAVDDCDNHGTQSPVLSVVDFKGKCFRNYRYGKIVLSTHKKKEYGMGPKGTDEYEYGGAYQVPGHPISISGTNVP